MSHWYFYIIDCFCFSVIDLLKNRSDGWVGSFAISESKEGKPDNFQLRVSHLKAKRALVAQLD